MFLSIFQTPNHPDVYVKVHKHLCFDGTMCTQMFKQFIFRVNNKKPHSTLYREDTSGLDRITPVYRYSHATLTKNPITSKLTFQIHIFKQQQAPTANEKCVSPSISNNVMGIDLKLHTRLGFDGLTCTVIYM